MSHLNLLIIKNQHQNYPILLSYVMEKIAKAILRLMILKKDNLIKLLLKLLDLKMVEQMLMIFLLLDSVI